MALCCPLCSASLAPSSLEAHLRFELTLPLVRCELCKRDFCGRADAAEHFRGPLAEHPGMEPQLIQPPSDQAKKVRLVELLRLARGGEEAVQQRLCVCGQCQLLCRQEPASSSGDEDEAKEESQKIPSELVRQAWDRHETDEDLPRPAEPRIASEHKEFPQEAPSEEEMPADVKPSLQELKPQMSTDGKVACLQCGKRTLKAHFAQHVTVDHIPGNPYQCLMCPESSKTRGKLAMHQKKEHGTELSKETISCSSSKEAQKEWIHLCFGEAKNVTYAGLRCRPCGREVPQAHLKEHVSTAHLKKTLHRCKACGYEDRTWKGGPIRRHLSNRHKSAYGPETVDSAGLEQFTPILQSMVNQLYEK